ncbi:bromodomain-containing protein [Anaeramoeba ignava]|uniref:Bromodomain-containing protein n=1 Tax=Anaeramoeba ignava TaxID=1746090 RepID=A0A9Q0LPQ2_ANAIG|nr:bromodomain-containing protein [Anaeramoeba ignava]
MENENIENKIIQSESSQDSDTEYTETKPKRTKKRKATPTSRSRGKTERGVARAKTKSPRSRVKGPKYTSEEEVMRSWIPRCEQMIKKIRGYPEVHYFLEPVPRDDPNVPDYYNIITNPMDIKTLENNLNSGYYKTLDEFIKSFRLIFDNAMFYNIENSEPYVFAKLLKTTLDKRYRAHRTNYEKDIENFHKYQEEQKQLQIQQQMELEQAKVEVSPAKEEKKPKSKSKKKSRTRPKAKKAKSKAKSRSRSRSRSRSKSTRKSSRQDEETSSPSHTPKTTKQKAPHTEVQSENISQSPTQPLPQPKQLDPLIYQQKTTPFQFQNNYNILPQIPQNPPQFPNNPFPNFNQDQYFPESELDFSQMDDNELNLFKKQMQKNFDLTIQKAKQIASNLHKILQDLVVSSGLDITEQDIQEQQKKFVQISPQTSFSPQNYFQQFPFNCFPIFSGFPFNSVINSNLNDNQENQINPSFSLEEREKLSQGINKLNENQLLGLIGIITKNMPHLVNGKKEIDFEFNLLDEKTFRELQRYVNENLNEDGNNEAN